MYDAYAGVTNDPVRLPPYNAPLPPLPAGDDRGRCRRGRVLDLDEPLPEPTRVLQRQADAPWRSRNSGHAYGQEIGKAILALRKDDPPASQGNYRPSKGRGRHRADPDNPGQGFHGPAYGKAKAFALKTRYHLDAPPFDNAEYKESLRQVRAKGIKPELMATLPKKPTKSAAQRKRPSSGPTGPMTALQGSARRRASTTRSCGRSRSPRARSRSTTPGCSPSSTSPWGMRESWPGNKNTSTTSGGRRGSESTTSPWARSRRPADAGGRRDLQECGPVLAPSRGAGVQLGQRRVTTAQATFPFANAQFGRVKNFTPNFPAYPSGHATFGAAAFQSCVFFTAWPRRKTSPDALLNGPKNPDGTDIFFISDEFNDRTQDNNGTVRPLHRRKFKDGVWEMIIENALSRIFLGVHWSFDAFAFGDDREPDLDQNIGGVRLGLNIAEDIFAFGDSKGPKKSSV